LGGVIPAIEMGYFQREIAEASSEYQNKVESNQRIIVGVNDFVKEDEEIEIPILEIRKEVEEEQISLLSALKATRDKAVVTQSLDAITNAAKNNDNLMPLIINAAKSYASMGEIVDAMKVVFGEWEENAVL
jgi:methylmalonyl-CoA mutase N-terminal domain/subunit